MIRRFLYDYPWRPFGLGWLAWSYAVVMALAAWAAGFGSIAAVVANFQAGVPPERVVLRTTPLFMRPLPPAAPEVDLAGVVAPARARRAASVKTFDLRIEVDDAWLGAVKRMMVPLAFAPAPPLAGRWTWIWRPGDAAGRMEPLPAGLAMRLVDGAGHLAGVAAQRERAAADQAVDPAGLSIFALYSAGQVEQLKLAVRASLRRPPQRYVQARWLGDELVAVKWR